MKLKFAVFALATLLCTQIQAAGVTWPSRPVIGVIGASFDSCTAPTVGPLMGIGFAGCSHEALTVKLLKNHQIEQMGFTVQTSAEGGARSYDIPDTNSPGLMTQYNLLKQRMIWFDGKQRLKYLVIDVTNDCLHTIACTENDIHTGLITNVKQVINAAQRDGVTVLLAGYPEWGYLNMPQIGAIFGLPYVIDSSGYATLKHAYETTLRAMPGVYYGDIWAGRFDTVDGLHPTEQRTEDAASDLATLIKNIEMNKRNQLMK